LNKWWDHKMKIEKKIVLKVESNERSYNFVCDEAAPLGGIWDALQEMKQLIFQQIQTKEAENQPKEQEKVEECLEQEQKSEPEA
jgi:hypothetical protein